MKARMRIRLHLTCLMRILPALILPLAASCRPAPPPDPNDPSQVGILQPGVLRNNLKWASDMVNDRVAKGEITPSEGKEYLSKYASELGDKVKLDKIPEHLAWQYAEVLLTAERWALAAPLLEIAARHARKVGNEDRFVNDTLHLAHAYARQGRGEEAIRTARSVFEVRAQDKAPILMGVLYEIAPALKGRGLDEETAKLLEDAIEQHRLAEVNPRTEAGASFLAAKWHHIRKAWEMVFGIYEAAAKQDLAEQARERAAAMMRTQGRI